MDFIMMGYTTVVFVLTGLLLQHCTFVQSQSLNIQAVGKAKPAAPAPPPQLPPRAAAPVYPARTMQYYPMPARQPPKPKPNAVEQMSDMEVMMMTSGGSSPLGLFNQILFREGKLSSNSIPESFRKMYHMMTFGRCPRSQRCGRRPACTTPTAVYNQASGCPQCPVCPFQVLENAAMSLLRSNNPIRFFAAQKIINGMAELPAGSKRRPRPRGASSPLASLFGIPPLPSGGPMSLFGATNPMAGLFGP